MWGKFPKRYLIGLFTCLSTCICYIERMGFSIAYTVAADAAGLNQSSKGKILSTFYYMAMHFHRCLVDMQLRDMGEGVFSSCPF